MEFGPNNKSLSIEWNLNQPVQQSQTTNGLIFSIWEKFVRNELPHTHFDMSENEIMTWVWVTCDRAFKWVICDFIALLAEQIVPTQ